MMGHYKGFDKHGRQTPPNKTPEYKQKRVLEHKLLIRSKSLMRITLE